MSASLVGSEMCIRDSPRVAWPPAAYRGTRGLRVSRAPRRRSRARGFLAPRASGALRGGPSVSAASSAAL
eukprot:15445722-Alexandrium_andersonii.AAC.1